MMIVRTTAIPLVCRPYSNTSRIVHWLTRSQGKVATLLKGALRSKSLFLGEYELFGTSELLYYRKRVGTLHVGRECALLHPRSAFRSDWRAMQAASYLSTLFSRTVPDEAPQPGLFELYEGMLDMAEQIGSSPAFLIWAELQFCDRMGHRPSLDRCIVCSSDKALRFSAASGGTVCSPCAKKLELPTLECPPDALAILRSWQRAGHPGTVVKTRLSERQKKLLDAILGTFIEKQFGIPPMHRTAVVI
jgi:DNA repair protein RecO (recombination protein O)